MPEHIPVSQRMAGKRVPGSWRRILRVAVLGLGLLPLKIVRLLLEVLLGPPKHAAHGHQPGTVCAVVAVENTPARGRASTSYAVMAEHMQRARLWLPVGSHGLLGEVPQARLLHDVGEPHELGLLGQENFAD